MNYRRTLTLTEGQHGFIQDEHGTQVTFDSAEEMSRYTGMDFTGVFYIGYEVEIDHFESIKNSGDEPQSHSIPHQPYEDLIDNVGILLERLQDPTYGLTGKELFDKQKEVDEMNLRMNYYTDIEKPVMVTVAEGTFTFNGGADSASAINGGITLAQNLGEPDVELWDSKNAIHTFSFESAQIISASIAKVYRDKALAKQRALTEIKNRVYEGD